METYKWAYSPSSDRAARGNKQHLERTHQAIGLQKHKMQQKRLEIYLEISKFMTRWGSELLQK